MPCGEAYKGDPFQDDFPALHGLLDAGQPVLGILERRTEQLAACKSG